MYHNCYKSINIAVDFKFLTESLQCRRSTDCLMARTAMYIGLLCTMVKNTLDRYNSSGTLVASCVVQYYAVVGSTAAVNFIV